MPKEVEQELRAIFYDDIKNWGLLFIEISHIVLNKIE